MKFPKSLKINGFTWKVKEDLLSSQTSNTWGTTLYQLQTITIDPTSTDERKVQTLLHEIMHVVFTTSGLGERLKDKDLTEEQIVTALSYGVWQVLKDNGLLKI